LGQVSTPFFGALIFEFCISENVNKTVILLTKMQCLQGFERKKRPCIPEGTQGQFYIMVLQIGFAPNQILLLDISP